MRDVGDILRAVMVERRYSPTDIDHVHAILTRAGMNTPDAAGIGLLVEYGLKYLSMDLDAPLSADFHAPCPVCGRSEADVHLAEKFASGEDDHP
jgi:hypothetical protein